MILYIIFGYYLVSVFIAGVKLADQFDESGGLFTAISLVALGFIPVLLYAYVLLPAFNFIDGYAQIRFWFAYLFQRKFFKMRKYALEDIVRLTAKFHNTNSTRDRYWRHCVKLVYRRNNYTPDSGMDLQDRVVVDVKHI